YLEADVASPFHERDGVRWYVTGDLGWLDERGALHLAGRLKRFVKVGGEMVSLPALEEALQERWPAGEDGPNLAIAAFEPEGQRPHMGLFTTIELTVDEANAVLKDAGVSAIARISSVTRVDALPLLGTGKTDYRELEGRLRQEQQ
ncbi:2-acyl-glycerophospho-ethanolamine acyltransferase, partial [bacterium]|nr:2-acyl-glycerophospho-ethanolamine acyltransferase [bacterium]